MVAAEIFKQNVLGPVFFWEQYIRQCIQVMTWGTILDPGNELDWGRRNSGAHKLSLINLHQTANLS